MTLSHFLKDKQHPCWYDVKPMVRSSKKDEATGDWVKGGETLKWPVVYFVGGIWNSCELYTTYCADIAAGGYVVILPEFEDGTGSFAQKIVVNAEKNTLHNALPSYYKNLHKFVREANEQAKHQQEGERKVPPIKMKPSVRFNLNLISSDPNIASLADIKSGTCSPELPSPRSSELSTACSGGISSTHISSSSTLLGRESTGSTRATTLSIMGATQQLSLDKTEENKKGRDTPPT